MSDNGRRNRRAVPSMGRPALPRTGHVPSAELSILATTLSEKCQSAKLVSCSLRADARLSFLAIGNANHRQGFTWSAAKHASAQIRCHSVVDGLEQQVLGAWWNDFRLQVFPRGERQ